MSNAYRNYQDLADLGKDYRIVVERRSDSSVAVVAPHGGSIELGTSEVARDRGRRFLPLPIRRNQGVG